MLHLPHLILKVLLLLLIIKCFFFFINLINIFARTLPFIGVRFKCVWAALYGFGFSFVCLCIVSVVGMDAGASFGKSKSKIIIIIYFFQICFSNFFYYLFQTLLCTKTNLLLMYDAIDDASECDYAAADNEDDHLNKYSKMTNALWSGGKMFSVWVKITNY